MQTSTPLQRQWQILISLMSRRNGQTVEELSHEAGVNTRTILRDLKTLRRPGFPLTERISEYGRKHWAMDDGALKVPIHFTWAEAVALHMGRQLLDPLAGTHFWHAAQTAFAKIRAMLGESALLQLDKVARRFLQTIPGRSDYGQKAGLIDNLMLAIEDHRIAFVAYQSERSTEPVSLELYPYGVVYHKSSLYLIAFSRDHGSIRHFKLDRVSDVDVQTLQFTPDANFSLQKHLSNSFGIYGSEASPGTQKILIRFSAEAARYVQEKTWHPSQSLKKEKDGSVMLEVQLDDTTEIKSWALSFGPRATVIAPESLREEIRQDIEKALENYQTDVGALMGSATANSRLNPKKRPK